MQLVVAVYSRFRQLCPEDISESQIYSSSTVRSWRFETILSGLHCTQRRRLEVSISCGGYSITTQIQMLGPGPTSHRYGGPRAICISTLSRFCSNATQTSTPSPSEGSPRCGR